MSASTPLAVLKLPVVLFWSAECAVGCIVGTGGVAKERFKTVGRVVSASGVAKERFKPVGRVVAASGVAIERLSTVGRVIVAGGVHRAPQRRWPVLKLPVVLLKSA